MVDDIGLAKQFLAAIAGAAILIVADCAGEAIVAVKALALSCLISILFASDAFNLQKGRRITTLIEVKELRLEFV